MHRFYLPPEHCTASTLRIEGREAHHALHVLRVKRCQPVVVLDGAGHEFLCDVAEASRNAVTLRITQKNSIPPLPCQITLLQALPKGKIIESIVQKVNERLNGTLKANAAPRLDQVLMANAAEFRIVPD